MPSSTPIQWSDALLTGVAEIDRQHRILVDSLVEARQELSDDVSDPLFEQITRDLLGYAIYHFDTEEQLMRRHGYHAAAPDAAARHVAQHRGFSERVVALRAAARLGEPGTKTALLTFLEDWLVNHIMTADKLLGEFVCDKE
ncbi:MAG: bacteriohemerythrin [Roseiarcus sp.]